MKGITAQDAMILDALETTGEDSTRRAVLESRLSENARQLMKCDSEGLTRSETTEMCKC